MHSSHSQSRQLRLPFKYCQYQFRKSEEYNHRHLHQRQEEGNDDDDAKWRRERGLFKELVSVNFMKRNINGFFCISITNCWLWKCIDFRTQMMRMVLTNSGGVFLCLKILSCMIQATRPAPWGYSSLNFADNPSISSEKLDYSRIFPISISSACVDRFTVTSSLPSQRIINDPPDQMQSTTQPSPIFSYALFNSCKVNSNS